MGDRTGAVEELRAARELQPDSAEITSALSIALIEKGAADEAMVLLKAWLEDHDDDVTARVNLGTALLQKGELEAAVNLYRDLAQRAPSNAVAAYNLGMALKQKDDFGPAETATEAAPSALDPTLPDAPYTLGVIYWQTGRAEEAATSFRAATVVRPDYAEAHSMLATVLVQQGENDEALSEVREAVRLAPRMAEAQLLLGQILKGRDDAEGARAAFAVADQLNKKKSDAQAAAFAFAAAEAKAKAGDDGGAIEGLRETLQLMPDNAEAHWRLRRAPRKARRQRGRARGAHRGHPPRSLLRPQRAHLMKLLAAAALTLAAAQAASTPPLQFGFTNVAKEAGLAAVTVFGGKEENRYLLETTGCGVGFIDYDNDGWLDVFLVNGSTLAGFPKGEEPTSHLYRNRGDGTFEDVTAGLWPGRERLGPGRVRAATTTTTATKTCS